MSEEKNTYRYDYSAGEQEEIRKIREKYVPREESKLEQLRRLDESVTRAGMIASLTVGVISMLLLGFGMCCTLVWAETLFVPGILIGVLGMGGMAAAPSVYRKVIRRKREKLAPEILRLTDELLEK